jgi:hypothetical protein
VVEIQVILLLDTIVQTVVIPGDPIEVLWIFTQRALELQVAFLSVMLFAPAFKIGRATDLKFLVG